MFPDHTRGTNAAGTTDSWGLAEWQPQEVCVGAGLWCCEDTPDSRTCQPNVLMFSTWSHIPPQARPSRCSPLAWGTSVMTSACFVPRFGREIKILLGKEKQTSKFCWPNWACGKAAKNKRENSKSTKNPSLERKRKGSGLTDTFPRMTNF